MSDTPAARPNLRNPVHVLAFGFGAGLSPYAPGTAGTVLAVFLYLSLAPLPLPYYVAICAALFVAGIWICGKPWPIGWLENRFRGGFSIMVDDLLAGLVTLGLLQLIHRLF